jgi:hypothetical protein
MQTLHSLSLKLLVSKATRAYHYWKQLLCRLSKALGKAWKTLDEGFAECDTRQRKLGELYIVNDFFDEYFLSGNRQSLCRVSLENRQRKVAVTATGNDDEIFADCTLYWHSAKSVPLPSVLGDTRQRVFLFVECPPDYHLATGSTAGPFVSSYTESIRRHFAKVASLPNGPLCQFLCWEH